ncbi:MAG: succinylglutamate desuccinylase/aspartoacylase family protein [Aliarcobacter sp.]|nr:succinylglutamate desuccinylase/aspartoacylase family protein [Aliarcobacter sp.]MBP6712922.1 succinylglutamate desuccinylase/aspartoacylase family protein [Aliarcobacter sp.]MBP7225404.1 succinylglutamate desuccinylase/aspartoacylase family protein [Aliarcobacter sp.]
MRFLLLFIPLIINAANLNFELYKKESNKEGNTLLIIGGIHGDEPGGYFAPAFLEKYYKIKSGNVWIVPNINGHSIMANTRGIYDDMNRKFSTIDKKDPDYNVITKIKKIILDKKVDLVLNLHDGYGFYRNKYENAIFNPNAWGQATIIDQEKIKGLSKFGNLDEIAGQVNNTLNSDKLFQDFHSFGVKNTETKFKDEQMKLSLTFFAVTNNKPAFAIETSKNITDLTHKVIYQLKSIEEFMNIMHIEFERQFDINNEEDVKNKIFDFGKVKINNNIAFDLSDIKKTTRFIPLKKDNNDFKFEHSLGAVKFKDNIYEIYIGNIKVADFYPQVFELAKAKNSIKIEVDGKVIETAFANEIDIKNEFKILKSDFRVNIIGYSKTGVDSEDDILINEKEILDAYSIDTKKRKYRAEFYKDGKFYGMIVLNFLKD